MVKGDLRIFGIEMALKGWFKEGKGIGFRGD